MSPDLAVNLGRETVTLMLYIAGPLLCAGLLTGLAMGVLQAITSVQEQTLTFVPKMVVVITVFILCMPWMARMLVGFAALLFGNLAKYGR